MDNDPIISERHDPFKATKGATTHRTQATLRCVCSQRASSRAFSQMRSTRRERVSKPWCVCLCVLGKEGQNRPDMMTTLAHA